MDYIFRWIQLRFLSGTQLDLFAGMTPVAPAPSIPIAGTVSSPGNRVDPYPSLLSAQSESDASTDVTDASASGTLSDEAAGAGSTLTAEDVPSEPARSNNSLNSSEVPQQTATSAAARTPAFSASVDASPQAILQREQRASTGSSTAAAPTNTAPVARDLAARSGLNDASSRTQGAYGSDASTFNYKPEDRGIYAPAEAMRAMYDMGDAPSCATCGAIMTRSGSCYRCMSCGSTSGCS